MSNENFAAIEAEQAAFDKLLDSMLSEHAGEFVVIKDQDPIGFFPTYSEAYETALDRFGVDADFLVSEVKRHRKEPVSLSWCAGVVFEGS